MTGVLIPKENSPGQMRQVKPPSLSTATRAVFTHIDSATESKPSQQSQCLELCEALSVLFEGQTSSNQMCVSS